MVALFLLIYECSSGWSVSTCDTSEHNDTANAGIIEAPPGNAHMRAPWLSAERGL
jgi:hypothetical protein